MIEVIEKSDFAARPEREAIPEFLRNTEQPLLGLILLVVPLAHGIRAVVWSINPPVEGGRGLAAVSGLLAVLFFALWRYYAAHLRSDEQPPWLLGAAVGLAAGSVQVAVATSGVLPLLAVSMAGFIVLRNDVARVLASILGLVLPGLFLDFSDPEVVLSAGSAVAVIIAGSGIVRRRRSTEDLRLAIRSRLVQLTSAADQWAARQTAMIAGLAHDVRGPLNGAALAIQIAELRLGDELASSLKVAAKRLEARCFDLSKRLTEVIEALRSRDERPVSSGATERESLLREWHAAEQVDLPVFSLTLVGLFLVVVGLHPAIPFRDYGLVGIPLVGFYGFLSFGSRRLSGWYGSDGATWLILAPALMWFGARAVELNLSSDLALSLTLFWVGAVSSRSLRTVLIAGAGIVALKLGASPVVDQTLIVVGIVAVAYVYRRSVRRMSEGAADWAIRVDRRHAEVQRDTVELNLSIAEEVRALRVLAHELVEDVGALVDEARAAGPDAAVDLFDRAHTALSGLDALIPDDRLEGQTRVQAKDVTDWLSTVFIDRINEKGGTLAVEVPQELHVAVPESTLKKILINLVDNAVKFSPHEGRVFIGARPIPGKERVLLTVSDQGPGIAESEVGRMFSWFERGSGDARPTEVGFGIGLGVVRDLAHEAGGVIDVESQPGSTSIHVTLPA